MIQIVPMVTIRKDNSQRIGCDRCDKVCTMGSQISQMEALSGRDCVRCYNGVNGKPVRQNPIQ